MGGAGQILLVAGALALAVLTFRSDYRPKAARRAQTKAPAAEVGSDRAEAIGRGAGRLAARGVQEYRKRRPPAAAVSPGGAFAPPRFARTIGARSTRRRTATARRHASWRRLRPTSLRSDVESSLNPPTHCRRT